MHFTKWQTVFDYARQINEKCRSLPDRKILELMLNGMPDKTSLNRETYNQICAELNYKKQGSPYYKLWPGITDALLTTKMNFTSALLKSPHEIFEIRFGTHKKNAHTFGTDGSIIVTYKPKKVLVLEAPETLEVSKKLPNVDGLYMDKIEKIRGKKLSSLVHILYKMPKDDGACSEVCFALFDNSTVESDINFHFSTYSEESLNLPENENPFLTPEQKTDLFRVVVGVMMFGVHNHEVVLPDIKTPVILGRGKKREALRNQATSKEIQKCNGWQVGSEINLPQAKIIEPANDQPKAGPRLKFGHIRSGHMRLQPYGPKRQKKKLIFIAPIVVKPELPVRPSPGYRINDSILKR